VVASPLILWSGWTTDWKLGVAILIGYAILVANRVFRLNPTAPVLDLRAAQWLPGYPVGMGVDADINVLNYPSGSPIQLAAGPKTPR
jgi:hypothetical protein